MSLDEWMKRLDPDGGIADIVEILTTINEGLEDILWMEGNLPTGHQTTVRSGLPTSTWRKMNYGTAINNGDTFQVVDTCGMLTQRSLIDKKLVELNGNKPEFRLSEDRPHIAGMLKDFFDTLFYGDTDVYPERFMGLDPRFNLTTATNGGQIILGGSASGQTDNTSIWIVKWGPNSVHGIFPKGSVAGLKTEDLGKVTVTDSAGGRYDAYETSYEWDCGLCVRDWHDVVRIPNIDVSELSGSSPADLCDLITAGIENLGSVNDGKIVIYCNKTVRSFLRRQIRKQSNVNLTLDNVAGKHVLNFDGIPVRRCDSILNTESRIV